MVVVCLFVCLFGVCCWVVFFVWIVAVVGSFVYCVYAASLLSFVFCFNFVWGGFVFVFRSLVFDDGFMCSCWL